MNNTKQLMLANQLYQGDNADKFPMAYHGGFVPGVNDTAKPWVTGWLDWGTSGDNTNTLYLTQPRYAVLANYFGKSKNIYLCPADKFLSSAQKALGWKYRARSVSSSIYIGEGNGKDSGPNNMTIYKACKKATDLVVPGPSQTWVYMDEHPDSINDAGAFPPNSAANIPDAPSTYHNGACGFAMADGHSEIHKWKGTTMNKARKANGLNGVSYVAQNNFGTAAKDPDVRWLSYNSPRNSDKTVVD